MTCWKAIRCCSNSTNASCLVQSHLKVSTITVTTRQAKCFLKMKNCKFVTIFRLFSTISILFVNSIMLAIFDSMFLIIFFLTIRPRCFLIIRDSLLVVTSLSIPHFRLRHRSKTLCRSYAKLWNSISPDVRKLPKFKFRKTLWHCLIKILIQEDGCVAMIRIVTIILWLPAYVYRSFQKGNILSA